MHVFVVIYAGLLFLYTAGASRLVVLAASGATVPLTLAGAMFPDLDHGESIPFRKFRPVATTAVTATGAVILYVARSLLVEIAVLLPFETSSKFLAGVLYVLVVGGIGKSTYDLIPAFRPTHHGLFHQLPTGIVVAGVLFSLLTYLLISLSLPYPLLSASVLVTGFFLGFFSHIAADTQQGTGRPLLLIRKTYIGQTIDKKLG